MRPEPEDIELVPVDESHLPLLAQWLREPHVRIWWGEPEGELELIREGLASGEVESFIASFRGEPVAYVQSWRPSQYESEIWARDFSSDVAGIDLFIGPPQRSGCGIGPAILRHFAHRLFKNGARRIVIDPDADNLRAIRAYAKAGFQPYDRFENGNGATVLMQLAERDIEEADLPA